MKKYCFKFICLVMAISALIPANFALAASETKDIYVSKDIALQYVNIQRIDAKLAIDSAGKGTCIGYSTAYSASDVVKMTMIIYNESGALMSWSTSASGSASLSQTWYVTSGHTYHVLVSVRVYSFNGSLLESASNVSSNVPF